MEPLRCGGDQLVIDSGDDGGGDGSYWFFIPFNWESINFFFFSLLIFFDFLLIVVENLPHAISITAFIVDQDEPFSAWSTDVTKHIFHTSMNINIALTFKQMIMW